METQTIQPPDTPIRYVSHDDRDYAVYPISVDGLMFEYLLFPCRIREIPRPASIVYIHDNGIRFQPVGYISYGRGRERIATYGRRWVYTAYSSRNVLRHVEEVGLWDAVRWLIRDWMETQPADPPTEQPANGGALC